MIKNINLDTKDGYNISSKEKKLITGLKQGDKNSFEQLFKMYHKRLYFFCFSLLNNKKVVEDITQDVFIKIWVNKESIDETKSFSGFLYTIAKNMIFNHIRKSLNKQKYLIYLNSQQRQSFQTETVISFNELQQAFDKLVKSMPKRRRQIYQLSKEKGLSRIEIAQKLHLSINTVDSQLGKAIKFIRLGLKEYLPLIILLLLIFAL